MSGSAGGHGPVWKPRPSKRRRLSAIQDDHLPAFYMLRNDEDRERKAEYTRPGTYHVILTPASFQDYEACSSQSCLATPLSTHLGDTHVDEWPSDPFPFGEQSRGCLYSSSDPDVVILRTFEDDSRSLVSPALLTPQSLVQRSRTSTLSLPCSTLSLPSQLSTGLLSKNGSNLQNGAPRVASPLMQMAHPDGRDDRLIYHYTNFLHRHLAQVCRDSLDTTLLIDEFAAPNFLERQAATFQPVSSHYLDALRLTYEDD